MKKSDHCRTENTKSQQSPGNLTRRFRISILTGARQGVEPGRNRPRKIEIQLEYGIPAGKDVLERNRPPLPTASGAAEE